MVTGQSVVTLDGFELAQRQARAFAGSALVPETLRGSFENCLVAMMLADEMGESRLAVMQNIYFVHGRAAWITAYMVGRANRSGKFRGPLRWKTTGTGDDLAVECFADLDGVDNDPRVSITVDLKTAIESGWTTFKDSKNEYKVTTHPRWATPVMQEQMLRWRSASWLIRLYAPETMMGLPTKEELEDISEREMLDVTPSPAPKLSDFAPNGQDRHAPAEAAAAPERKEEPHRPEPQTQASSPQETGDDAPSPPGHRYHIPGPSEIRARRQRRTKAQIEADRKQAELDAKTQHMGGPRIEPPAYAVTDHDSKIHEFDNTTDATNFLGGLFAGARGQRAALEALREDNQEFMSALAIDDLTAFGVLSEAYESELAISEPTTAKPGTGGASEMVDRQGPVAAESRSPERGATFRASYAIEPVYNKDRQIDYRVMFIDLLMPKLRAAETREEFDAWHDDNRDIIQAYKNTLAPAGAIAAAKEIDDILAALR